MNQSSTNIPVYENISIQAVLHLPPRAIWALIWRRAQANALKYQQEFDTLGNEIQEKAKQYAKEAKQITQEFPLPCPLPLDEKKRPYLSVNNFILSTIDLIDLTVRQFHAKMNLYPETIYLSPERWTLGSMMKYLIMTGIKIPYALGTNDYDVCCVGAPLLNA